MQIFKLSVFAVSVISLAMPASSFAKGGASCTKKLVNKCREDGMEAGATRAVAVKGAKPNASIGQSEATAASLRTGAAAKECKASAEDCEKCPEHEREECKKAVGEAAGNLEAQSASMGDAGAAMGALAGMMGALAPLLMKKDEEEEEPQQAMKFDGALQANGQIDCSKNDAFNFPDCNEQLSASCKNAMEDPRCQSFASRFCGPSSPASRIGPGVPYGGSGEGGGSQFCQHAAAYNYCRSGAYSQCPSCLKLEAKASPASQANPYLGLADISHDTLNRLYSQCQTDPIYATYRPPTTGNGGGVLIGGGSLPGGIPVGGAQNPNLPTAVLPGGPGQTGVPPVANVSGGNAAPANPVAAIPPAPGTNPVIHPGTGIAIASAKRDGSSAQNVGSLYGAGGDTAASGFNPASASKDRFARGVSSEVAASGPAPDVQGQFGPGIFSLGTSVIRNRCAAGKFLNCP